MKSLRDGAEGKSGVDQSSTASGDSDAVD